MRGGTRGRSAVGTGADRRAYLPRGQVAESEVWGLRGEHVNRPRSSSGEGACREMEGRRVQGERWMGERGGISNTSFTTIAIQTL